MEDFAYIIDYLAQGRIGDRRQFRKEPIALAVGETEYKLFELTLKPNATVQIGDKVYIGKDIDLRLKIAHVKSRIGYESLTGTAQSELAYVLLEIVKSNENRFIEFFNKSQPISPRYHILELLPGLGKKTMLAIITERKKGDFKSFQDIITRVPALHNPDKVISKRIEYELKDKNQKYHVFVTH